MCADCDGSGAERLSAGCGRPLSRGCAGAASGGAADLAGDSAGALAPAGSACSASAPSVLRKRAASGPSRMLARLAFAIVENLLRELSVGLGRYPIRLVLEHRHALDGRLGEADGLADARGKYPVSEVFLEDLDRLLGVDRPGIHQRRQDTLDVDARIKVLADHRE